MPQRLKLKEHQQLPYLTVLRKMWFILTILKRCGLIQISFRSISLSGKLSILVARTQNFSERSLHNCQMNTMNLDT